MRRSKRLSATLDPPNSCLHLVAGAARDALIDCLAQAHSEDAIVFLDAGVLHLLGSGAVLAGGSAGCVGFAGADLEAHGLAQMARQLEVDILDDAGICGLLALHRHCLTWT